jgi:hypothetical protein
MSSAPPGKGAVYPLPAPFFGSFLGKQKTNNKKTFLQKEQTLHL